MASKGQQHHDQPKEAGTLSIKDYASVIPSLQKGRGAQAFDPGTHPQTGKGNAIRARFQNIIKSVPAMKKNTYRHEPIDCDNEIRILKILRGSSNDKLECMLFPSKLGQVDSESRRDRYWALSYWWGEEMEVASNKITIYHDNGARGPPSEIRSRKTFVSDEATNLINPEPNTSLTGLCLICHDHLMHCILDIDNSLSYVDHPEQKRLHSIRKRLEEDYLRLDLWITDSYLSEEHDYLALGPPIVKPIQTSLSAIHEQLLLAKEEIYALRHSKLGPDFEVRFLRIEAACQSITIQMHILAEMQGLIHNAQVDQFPEIGPRAYLQAEIADVFENFQNSDADPKSTDDETVTEDSVDISSEVGGQKCEHCGKFFNFGALELHYEFRHSKKEPKLVTSVTPSTSELFCEEALDDIPTPQRPTSGVIMTPFNPSGTFCIRKNLKAALLRLRDPHHDVEI